MPAGFNPTQPKKKSANETPMTDAEKKIYKIEMRLIKKHFPGLKPRPIKIDDTLSYMAQAAEPSMLFNMSLHGSEREIRPDRCPRIDSL